MTHFTHVKLKQKEREISIVLSNNGQNTVFLFSVKYIHVHLSTDQLH